MLINTYHHVSNQEMHSDIEIKMKAEVIEDYVVTRKTTAESHHCENHITPGFHPRIRKTKAVQTT